MENSPKIQCPKCSSDQITANKKGFSGGKALVGGALTGGIGLLAGTIGSGKVIITCLNCGNQWKPGQPAASKAPLSEETLAKRRKINKVTLTVFAIIMGLIILIALLYK
jgi:hypothetical protein